MENKDITVLAIESSCDETAAAVVVNGRRVLSNIISSQIDIHKLYGGVVPEIASRKHIERINQVIQEALSEADRTLDDMDAVCVTYGPGLVGALLVGVAEAKAISFAAGIPLVGCGTLSSALCMDKDRAHRLAELAGVRVPRAMVLMDNTAINKACAFAENIGFPVFVKPVKAGSSFGVTKVSAPEQLAPAIALAFDYDNRVILEEAIDGFEVGCAVCGRDQLTVGEVDEIELDTAACANGFFDYTEKYTLKTSAIHVPARIAAEKAQEIKEAAKRIYRALDCDGFARVDMFLTPAGEIVFNEVNTIPGFTEHSRYPGMMRAAGYGFAEVVDRIIGQAFMS